VRQTEGGKRHISDERNKKRKKEKKKQEPRCCSTGGQIMKARTENKKHEEKLNKNETHITGKGNKTNQGSKRKIKTRKYTGEENNESQAEKKICC